MEFDKNEHLLIFCHKNYQISSFWSNRWSDFIRKPSEKSSLRIFHYKENKL